MQKGCLTLQESLVGLPARKLVVQRTRLGQPRCNGVGRTLKQRTLLNAPEGWSWWLREFLAGFLCSMRLDALQYGKASCRFA